MSGNFLAMESTNNVTTPDRTETNINMNEMNIQEDNNLPVRNSVSKFKSLALSDSPAGVEDILNDSVNSINSINSIDDNNSVSLIKLPLSARNDSDDLPIGEIGEISQLITAKDLGDLDIRNSREQPTMLSELYMNEDDNDSSMSDINFKQSHHNQLMITDEQELDLDDDEIHSDSYDNDDYGHSEYEDLKRQASLARMWSKEMDSLINSRTLFEAAACINRVSVVLDDLDEADRFNYCKADFESSVETLRVEEFPWWEELSGDIIQVMNRYFDESMTKYMPDSVVQDIFLWLTVEDIKPISEVCTEWYELATDCVLWTQLYERKFIYSNPETWPTPRLQRDFKFKYLYQLRIRSPCIGDKVEVAWRGKFRLEAQEVYQGLAWWVAEVVDCHEEQDRYKIRYCGWDAHWDDWIPRDRLRWAVDSNIVQRIVPNDNVELWCFGSNVPGAWLETKITKIRGNRYYLDNQVIAQSGQMWVRRDRLRFVSREAEEKEDIESYPVMLSRNSSGSSRSLIGDGGENIPSNRRHSFSQSLSSLTRSLSSRLSSFRSNGGGSSSHIENVTSNDSSSLRRSGSGSSRGSALRERAQSHSNIPTTHALSSSIRGTRTIERRHSNGEVTTENPRHSRQRLDSAPSLISTSPSRSRSRSRNHSRSHSLQLEDESLVVDEQDPRLSNSVTTDNRLWRQVRVSRASSGNSGNDSEFHDADGNLSRRSSFDRDAGDRSRRPSVDGMEAEVDVIHDQGSRRRSRSRNRSRAGSIGDDNGSLDNGRAGSRRRSRSNSTSSNFGLSSSSSSSSQAGNGADRSSNFERRNSTDRRERMDDSYDDRVNTRTSSTERIGRVDRIERSNSGRSRNNNSSQFSRSMSTGNNNNNRNRQDRNDRGNGRRAIAPLRHSNTAPAGGNDFNPDHRRHGSQRGSCALM